MNAILSVLNRFEQIREKLGHFALVSAEALDELDGLSEEAVLLRYAALLEERQLEIARKNGEVPPPVLPVLGDWGHDSVSRGVGYGLVSHRTCTEGHVVAAAYGHFRHTNVGVVVVESPPRYANWPLPEEDEYLHGKPLSRDEVEEVLQKASRLRPGEDEDLPEPGDYDERFAAADVIVRGRGYGLVAIRS